MFQLFGNIMHFVPTETQLIDQKNLPKPVFTNNIDRRCSSFGRQAHPLIFHIVAHSLFSKFFQHIGYGGSPCTDFFGNSICTSSQERRVGKEFYSPVSSRCSQYNK